MARPFTLLCMLAAGVLGHMAVAQATTGDLVGRPERDRAARAKVTLRYLWRWGEGGMPEHRRFQFYNGGTLAFSGDDAWLAMGGDQIFGMVDGKVRSVKGEWLVGPAAGDQFLRGASKLSRVGVETQQQELNVELPGSSGIDPIGSPAGGHVLLAWKYDWAKGRPNQLVDVATATTRPIGEGDLLVTAVAWNADESRIALAFRRECNAAFVGVYDRSARLLRRIVPDAREPVTALAFDLDGRSIVWSGRLLHRTELVTGKSLTWGEPRQEWWAPIDEGLAIGHDGRRLTLFANGRLDPVRVIDLGEPGDDARVEATALSHGRRLLAVAMTDAVRVYAIEP